MSGESDFDSDTSSEGLLSDYEEEKESANKREIQRRSYPPMSEQEIKRLQEIHDEYYISDSDSEMDRYREDYDYLYYLKEDYGTFDEEGNFLHFKGGGLSNSRRYRMLLLCAMLDNTKSATEFVGGFRLVVTREQLNENAKPIDIDNEEQSELFIHLVPENGNANKLFVQTRSVSPQELRNAREFAKLYPDFDFPDFDFTYNKITYNKMTDMAFYNKMTEMAFYTLARKVESMFESVRGVEIPKLKKKAKENVVGYLPPWAKGDDYGKDSDDLGNVNLGVRVTVSGYTF